MPSLINKLPWRELLRYGTVTVVSYGFLYFFTIALVEGLGWTPSAAYAVSLGLVYVGVYLSYSLFVFQKSFTASTASRFLISLAFIWLMNNSLFFILQRVVGLPYQLVIVLNLIVLGGVRFFIQRHYVFR